jgi:protease IV
MRLSSSFLALAVALPLPALAQGLENATTGSVVPHSSSAAADDAFALYVNPAGLAFVDGFQLVGGYAGRFGPNPLDHMLLSGAASPFEGFVLGAGGALVLQPLGVATPYIQGSLSSAVRFDRSLAFGGTLHALRDAAPGVQTRWQGDLGVQARPMSWLALGLSLDNLGAGLVAGSSARAGLAIRPLWQFATLGLDARFRPGNEQALSSSFYTQGVVDTGATARFVLGGLALTLGAVLRDSLSPARDVAVMAGVQVDTSHLGSVLLGGWESDGNWTGGAFARASIERFDSVVPRGGEWLSFTLVGDGQLERGRLSPLEQLLSTPEHPVTILAALDRAAEDPRIDGVVLRLRSMSLGWGRVAELRDSILNLRAAGKRVVVHLDGGDDAEVYLSSAANRVFLTPAGGLAFDGLHVTLAYVSDLLGQLGVKAEAVSAGEYKTAPRTFTASEPSPEELEVQESILDGLYGRLREAVAEGRGLETEEVQRIIERGGLTADDAMAENLVDGLAYWDEVPSRLEDLAGRTPRLRRDYLDEVRRYTRWTPPPRIAVVPVIGEITQGRAEGGLFNLFGGRAGSEDVIDALRAAAEDNAVKAVILRIDSPGGDALASDQIWHAVMALREKKPVLASMGDTAASGGYYIAAAAQEIFAEPQTVTGSIGVFSLLFSAEELAQELGVSDYELYRGAEPPPSLLRPLSEARRARMQQSVDWVYRRFLEAVALGRGMDIEDVMTHAEGRVWTGAQAKERGLVDELGGFAQALQRARQLAELGDDPPDISILTGSREIFPRIGTAVSALQARGGGEAQVQGLLRLVLSDPEALQVLQHGPRPLARARAKVNIE